MARERHGQRRQLTEQLAAARLATAKYATNLARAKADGYQIITHDDAEHGLSTS